MTGQIHDLGYQRYAGARRSTTSRWTVILRHQIATAWQTWWRFKAWLVVAVLATGTGVALIYLASDTRLRMVTSLRGAEVQLADGILPTFLGVFGVYDKIGFIAALFVATPAIARDVQSGAFTFYFARSVRPRDYVLGKLAGIGAVMALLLLAGPLVIALARLGLSDYWDDLIARLPTVAKALAVGVLGTVVYTAMPLACSALARSRGHAMALWAGYYVVFSNLVVVAAMRTSAKWAVLDLPTALQSITLSMFDLQLRVRRSLDVPAGAAVISIAAHAAVAIGLMFWQVRNAQRAGVGGAA